MTVVIENTGFNVNYWARFDEQQFIQHGLAQQVFKDRDYETRIELLAIAYQQVQYDAPRDAEKA